MLIFFLNVHIHFYLSEFLCSFLFGMVVYISLIHYIKNMNEEFFLLSIFIIYFAAAVLIIIFEEFCLAHFNPSYTLGEFLIRRYLNFRFDIYILIFMIIAQYGGFALSGIIVKLCYNGIAFKTEKFKRSFLLKFISGIFITVLSLNCRRKNICSPFIITAIYISFSILGDSLSGRTYNPAAALGTAIIFNNYKDYYKVILSEFGGAIVGSMLWIIIFSKKW